MTGLAVKDVQFNGATLRAAQDAENIIWVGKVFGYYYNEYEDKLPFEVELLININNLKTEKEVLQWYVDLNEGGTPHTSEEIDKVKQMIEDLDS